MKTYKTYKETAARAAKWVHERRSVLAVSLGLLLAILLSDAAAFAHACGQVRADTLRLHILANSDSDADQSLKLAVRDAILAEAGALFSTGADKADALAAARRALPELEAIAAETLRAHGCSDAVTVRLENMYFSTREYDGFTLPAGRYDAVRIELGAHEGRNWFCVLYPPLCLPAASEDSTEERGAEGSPADGHSAKGGAANGKSAAENGASYTDSEEAVIHCPYQLRFAAVELFESLREMLLRGG